MTLLTLRTRYKRLLGTTLAMGVVAAATTAASSAVAVHNGDGTITVHAMFADAGTLAAGNVVKAAGVTVGSVDSITLDHGLANVSMSVARAVLPLHKDARATITEQDLLGERYVSIDRGSPASPTMDERSAAIPASQTGRTVDLQTIFNGVDTPTGTALGALVSALGHGVDGRGKDIAAGIEKFEPSLRQADELGKLLSSQNQVLTQIMDSAAPAVSALAADDGRTLDSFVGGADQTLSAVAANRDATKDALDRLPGTLAAAQRTLAQVAGVSDNATPTLAAMRPVTDDLTDISGELERFSDAADPALGSLPPVLDRGREMLDEAGPVAQALRPAGRDIRDTASAGRPIMEKAFSGRLVNLMEFMKGWSLSTAEYDGLSHYFRAFASLTPKALGHSAAGPVPGAPYAPVPSAPVPNLGIPQPLGPAPDQQSRDASRGHVAPPDPHQDSPGNFPPRSGTDTGKDDGATGMDEKQENAMLGQLLGGQ